jgi:hypothetical protein
VLALRTLAPGSQVLRENWPGLVLVDLLRVAVLLIFPSFRLPKDPHSNNMTPRAHMMRNEIV